MSYFMGTASYGTTGVKTVTCGFQPTRAKITVVNNGAADPIAHKSVGDWDGTNQICDTWAVDTSTSDSYSDRFTDRMVGFYEFNAGNPTLVARSNHDSVTTTAYKHNVITANANCQYKIELWN